MSEIGAFAPTPFVQRITHHARYVRRVLRGFGLRGEELDDACQEALLIAHKQWSSFEGRSSTETWLYGICRHVVRNERRRAYRRRELLIDEPPEPPELATPYASIDRNHQKRWLRRALASLSEPQRETLLLYEIGQLSAEDVADFLRSAPRTVRARVYAGRRQLKRRLVQPRPAPRSTGKATVQMMEAATRVRHEAPLGDRDVSKHGLRRAHVDDGVWIGSLGRILLTHWSGAPTMPRIRMLGEEMAAVCMRHPGRALYIDVIESTSPLPAADVRIEIRRQMHTWRDHLRVYAGIVSDARLRQMLRGFLTSAGFLTDSDMEVLVFSGPQEAASWLQRHRIVNTPDEQTLLDFASGYAREFD